MHARVCKARPRMHADYLLLPWLIYRMLYQKSFHTYQRSAEAFIARQIDHVIRGESFIELRSSSSQAQRKHGKLAKTLQRCRREAGTRSRVSYRLLLGNNFLHISALFAYDDVFRFFDIGRCYQAIWRYSHIDA